MIVLGTITSLMNGTTIFKIILGIRPIVKYVLLFLVILNSKLFNKTTFINFFINFVFYTNSISYCHVSVFFILGLNGDPATGSLRSSGIGMILQISMLCISLRLYTTYRKSLSYLLIITIMLVLPMIGESKAFFFLLPLILIYSFKKEIFSLSVLNLLYGFLGFLIFFIALDYYGSIQGNVGNLSSVFFNPSLFFTDPGYYFSTFGRLETIFQSHKAITSSYLSTIFGFGLGSKTLTASEVYASHAMAFDRFTALTYLDHLMFEVGYLGLGIYLLFLF